MKQILKIIGIIALEIVFISILIGLIIGTVWMFHKCKTSDCGLWSKICVYAQGIGCFIIVPVYFFSSIVSTKERIRKIKKGNIKNTQ